MAAVFEEIKDDEPTEDEEPSPRPKDRIADEGPLDKREGDETSS